MTSPVQNPYRLLPSVEQALSWPELKALEARVSRTLLVEFVQDALADWREEIRSGGLGADDLQARLDRGEFQAAVAGKVTLEEGRGLRRVINATGVVLHTGLGRAPVHPEAAQRMGEVAGSYALLEVDRHSGQRNRRDDRVSELLSRLTGAEAGIAVNNNAAACVLILSTFAAGRETIVSRGELVEIGGSFRMPDVMERANTKLVEVGTTNRTRAADFRAKVGERTGLLMKVHTSNFRQVGFVEELSVEGLAALGRELGVPTAYDLGSGLIDAGDSEALRQMGDEPHVGPVVESGIDVVAFSGDKLLGGPQSGLLVGRKERIEELRKNPLYRALRLDKVGLAGLECTLELYLAGRADEIPARAMVNRQGSEVRALAERLAREIGAIGGMEAEVAESAFQPGSGSAPGVFLPSFCCRVQSDRFSVQRLAGLLRRSDPPIFARLHEDRLLLDPRTLFEGDAASIVAAFGALARKAD